MKKSLDNFLLQLADERGLSENTIDAYRGDLSQYLEFVERSNCRQWCDVTNVMVMNYLYSLKDRGLAPATLARKAAAVRGLHRYLLRSGQTDNDPAYTLNHLTKASEKFPPAVLSLDQMEQLLSAPDQTSRTGKRDHAMLEVLYATGMRVSECIKLNREHVNLEMEFVRCCGSRNHERVLPLNGQSVQALREYIGDRDQDPAKEAPDRPLFLNRLNKRLSRQGVWKILKYYAVQAGIKDQFSPETIRQSLTAHLFANGAPIEFVDELMGRAPHASALRFPRSRRQPLKKIYMAYHPRAKKENE
ncbi:tyrosine-type recombinase/integrase [Sporolactobacillus inulinus]|uniref:tyrosine-type recombinase/integrase n=1 Tax=Sporolactobacillus inulinus TaxID=2078 RepID=UPI000255C6FF|nr:tyrosine-type recombinase/integrase [Sporolactobacillus inulinus]GEB77129.1 tyrosine recombinase XerD [Sporolactobacillus inulinus]